jgi:hypothetical protein
MLAGVQYSEQQGLTFENECIVHAADVVKCPRILAEFEKYPPRDIGKDTYLVGIPILLNRISSECIQVCIHRHSGQMFVKVRVLRECEACFGGETGEVPKDFWQL